MGCRDLREVSSSFRAFFLGFHRCREFHPPLFKDFLFFLGFEDPTLSSSHWAKRRRTISYFFLFLRFPRSFEKVGTISLGFFMHAFMLAFPSYRAQSCFVYGSPLSLISVLTICIVTHIVITNEYFRMYNVVRTMDLGMACNVISSSWVLLVYVVKRCVMYASVV